MAYQIIAKCIATGSRVENGRVVYEADFALDGDAQGLPRADIALTVLAPHPFTPGASFTLAFLPEAEA